MTLATAECDISSEPHTWRHGVAVRPAVSGGPRWGARLDDAGGDGGTDGDQDEATEEFAALAGPGAEHRA